MKYEFYDEPATLTPTEVAEQLLNGGSMCLDEDERIFEARLECGCDLEVEILKTGTTPDRAYRTITFTETYILNELGNAEWCQWAKDESGADVLLCFGNGVIL